MKGWKSITVMAPLALALSVAASPAYAKHRGRACREDVQKLCPDVTPGGGGIRTCLSDHAAELSPACREHVNRMQAKIAAWQQACGADVQQFCADAGAKHGKLKKCLRHNRDNLSQACRDQIAQHHGRHHHHVTNSEPSNG